MEAVVNNDTKSNRYYLGGIDGNGGNELQLVAFTLGTEDYALEITFVQEIIRLLDITRVPHAPSYVEGVVNLRGTVVPVIDLRQRFKLPGRVNTDNTRIIITSSAEGHGGLVGFIVDAVSEVFRLPGENLEPPPTVRESADAEYLDAIGKQGERLFLLLNAVKVIGEGDFS